LRRKRKLKLLRVASWLRKKNLRERRKRIKNML
jgi:hypothetical protein